MIAGRYTLAGMHVTDHVIEVPLDWFEAPQGETIQLFAREVVDPARASEDLPLLLFLEGGPGGKAPRPGIGPGWLTEALKTYRVVLPDQRGTGRSTRIEPATMARFADGAAAGDHLARFRADSIVADFEHLRKTVFGGRRWKTLGQSYGGFLTLTYLSVAPEGLAACLVAGGLPGLEARAEDVYRRTFERVRAKTARYYARYPDDVAAIGRIADLIENTDVRLPDGDRLSVRRLRSIGLAFGMRPGFDAVHFLLDEAWSSEDPDRLSSDFLGEIARLTGFATNPLFAVLQESIYGQGEGATGWSAERVGATLPAFDVSARPLLFTGEMMFSWMFDEISTLRPYKAGAEALAQRPSHTALYDPVRLDANEVPVSAVIYFDDMYVDAGLSLETAARVGNLETWVTNEYEHDGIRETPDVFRRLEAMTAARLKRA